MTSAENLRLHAAGHLDAAHALAEAREVVAAKFILNIVRKFCDAADVSAPPAVYEKLDAAISSPCAYLEDIELLRQWFVDPFNTAIESGNVSFHGAK